MHHYREEYGIETRIVRFHNIFGPLGTWTGGREKAPAAMCRKVAIAKLTGNHEIEIWGDGEQTRSFCYIDDCVVGIHKLMRSDYREPLNLGQDRLVTINELADMVAQIAGIKIGKKHVPGRRECAAATPTTPGCARCWAGSRKSAWRKVSHEPMRGSRTRSEPDSQPRPRLMHPPSRPSSISSSPFPRLRPARQRHRQRPWAVCTTGLMCGNLLTFA